jgi:hypothetical protein
MVQLPPGCLVSHFATSAWIAAFSASVFTTPALGVGAT